MDAAAKTQAFAHRLVEFADHDKCVQYLTERKVDLDKPNSMGWSVLMSVCACGRDDLVGFVLDHTTAVHCATVGNCTTALHLAAMSKNARVVQQLTATADRRQKLRKVVEQPNANGDTALMMACVAKSVSAVELLLELGASLTAVNASGLNALMCAARACDDPRSGAPTHEELIARSAAIVKILLANDADVNAVEAAGGNTALHLAVLSENVAALKCLLDAPGIDLSWRNEVGNTALDMTNHISGVASAKMADLLRKKWSQCEEEAARVRDQVEQELMSLAIKEAENGLDRKQTASAKANRKKSKKNRKKGNTADSMPAAPLESTEEGGKEDDAAQIDENSVAETQPENGQVESEANVDDDEGSWQSVLPKKSRHKEFIDDKNPSPPRHPRKKSDRKPAPNAKTSKKTTQESSKPSAIPPRAEQETQAVSLPPKAPWLKAKDSPLSPRSQEGSVEDDLQSPASGISYDLMNGSFRRTFPVAAELEIGVEKFLIASSVSDRELEPSDSLSISQVEALQEAHWQACHYLNEKKIELTRVLEAQRVEAQFALQQELMQMK